MWHRDRTGHTGPPEATGRLVRIRGLLAEEGSLDELLAATGDVSIEVVREALARLARLGAPSAAQVLRWRIWRADPSLVGDFARCIAALGDRDAIEEALTILEARGDDGSLYGERVAALALLGAFADPATIPTIRGALEDRMAAVRQTALAVLRRFLADAATQRAVIARLADCDPQVRAAAAASVYALCPDPSALLQELAGDESSIVRAAVARAAARLGEKPSRLLLEDRQIGVRELTAEHAGACAVVPLARAMRRDSSQPVRQAAARRLGELHAEQATAELLDALADPNSVIRVIVLGSLEAIHGSRLPGLLLDAIRDPGCEERAALVYALGRLDATSELAALRDNPDPEVHAALGFVRRESQDRPAGAPGRQKIPIQEEVTR
jgi:HEAT repeat protein